MTAKSPQKKNTNNFRKPDKGNFSDIFLANPSMPCTPPPEKTVLKLEQGGIGAPMEPTEPISEAAGQNGVLYDSLTARGSGWLVRSLPQELWDQRVGKWSKHHWKFNTKFCRGPLQMNEVCILYFIVILLLQMHDKLLQSSLNLVGALKIKPFMIHC